MDSLVFLKNSCGFFGISEQFLWIYCRFEGFFEIFYGFFDYFLLFLLRFFEYGHLKSTLREAEDSGNCCSIPRHFEVEFHNNLEGISQ